MYPKLLIIIRNNYFMVQDTNYSHLASFGIFRIIIFRSKCYLKAESCQGGCTRHQHFIFLKINHIIKMLNLNLKIKIQRPQLQCNLSHSPMGPVAKSGQRWKQYFRDPKYFTPNNVISQPNQKCIHQQSKKLFGH